MVFYPDKKVRNLLTIAGLGVGFVYATRTGDPATENIIVRTLDRTDFEGWDFAHLGLHFTITAMDYKNFSYSLFLSLVWELIEKLLAEDDPYWDDDKDHDYKVNTIGMLAGMLYNVYFVEG